MIIAARLGTSADIPVAAGLAQDAAATIAFERGGAIFTDREFLSAPYEDSLAAVLYDDDALLILGTVDDVVVGVGLARLQQLHAGGLIARLELLWVEPEARGVGLGEAMTAFASDWASASGALGMDAYALPGNREAKNFLEASGFVARLIVMHRPSPEPPDNSGASRTAD